MRRRGKKVGELEELGLLREMEKEEEKRRTEKLMENYKSGEFWKIANESIIIEMHHFWSNGAPNHRGSKNKRFFIITSSIQQNEENENLKFTNNPLTLSQITIGH